MSSRREAEQRRFYDLCAAAAWELYGLCPEFSVGRPRDPKNGDLASSAALALGGALKRRPSEIAAELAERIEPGSGERLEVGDKGFLNLYFSAEFLHCLLEPARELPEIRLPELQNPGFCRVHCYNRLKKLLELRGAAPVNEPTELTAPEELRLLRAIFWDEPAELEGALTELYDSLGLGGGARTLLINNGLYLLYGHLK